MSRPKPTRLRPTPEEADADLVQLIGMWLDFDEDLSEFESDLVDEVLNRFDACPNRDDFLLTAHERAALEPVWEAISKAAEKAPEFE